MQRLWGSKIPLKVKIFLCLYFNGRAQTLDQLVKRGWKGENKCILCGEKENIDYFLFPCILAKFFLVLYERGVKLRPDS